MSIDFSQLRELLGAIAQTDITELTLKSEDFELIVRKDSQILPVAAAVSQAPLSLSSNGPAAVSPSVVSPSLANSTPPANQTPPVETPEATVPDKKWVAITSPMVGTFYRAPAPDEAPFAEVGDRIAKGQTVCIIEAMKLMNEIEAEISGRVMEIVAKNSEPVEYGQTLMWIDPS